MLWPTLPVQKLAQNTKVPLERGSLAGGYMMHFFDLQQDFFLPVWRRVAVVVVCIAWGIVEFMTAAPFWGIIFGGMGVFAAWQFFFDGWPADNKAKTEKESGQ